MATKQSPRREGDCFANNATHGYTDLPLTVTASAFCEAVPMSHEGDGFAHNARHDTSGKVSVAPHIAWRYGTLAMTLVRKLSDYLTILF